MVHLLTTKINCLVCCIPNIEESFYNQHNWYVPGLNMVVPFRYAYSFGLRSRLQNFLRQDLSLLTPAMVGCSLSRSGLSWWFRRIFFSMLSVGMSVTSKSTCSWAKPRMKRGAQQLLRSANWSLGGSWLKAGRFFMKWMVFTRTAVASLPTTDGFFKHTLRLVSQLHLWGSKLWLKVSGPALLLSMWLRML